MKKALLDITTLGIILFFGVTAVNAQTTQDIAKKGLTSTVSLVMDNDGYGSGFFVDSDQIATAYHVVEGASSGYVSPVHQEDKYPIVGITAIDKDNDLVILKVSGARGTPLPIGDSEKVEIQHEVIVVGNPLGYEGTVTDGKIINNSLGNRLLTDATINRGNSGGALLNSKGEVIGVAIGKKLDIVQRPNTEDDVNIGQGINVTVPSKYLSPLVEKARLGKETLKPLSVDGVTGTHLTWGPDYYEFTLHNQRSQTIRDVDYLVIFKDRKGEILCADRSQLSGIMYAGGASRQSRDLISKWIDHSDYDPGRSDGFLSIFDDFNDYSSSNVGPRIKQLMKSYEIRILDFDIDTIYTRRGIPLEGVTGSGFTWLDKDPDSSYIWFSYSLQNHLSQYLENVFCEIIFYDKDGSPIDESLPMGTGISAMEIQPRDGIVKHSVKRLTKRVGFRIYQ